jgi:hypothetical protein
VVAGAKGTFALLVIEQTAGIRLLVLCLSTVGWMRKSRDESERNGWYGLNAYQ